MEDKFYYPWPVQVRYVDPKKFEWRGGIVIEEKLFCGDGAQCLNLNTYFNYMSSLGFAPDDVLVELDWIDLEQKILDLKI